MQESAQGVQQPLSQGLESFIPSRMQTDAPQESTEDIITRTASWVSDIKKAAVEMQKAYETASKGSEAVPSAGTAFAEGFSKASEKAKETEKEDRIESFISRRSEDSPSTYAPERPQEREVRTNGEPIPLDAAVPNILDAIAAVESRGSGDYAAIGPVVGKGMYKGQRAYGRYQVMEGNIAPWSKEVFGRAVSVEEFMADPKIQDTIAAHQLQKAKDRWGTWEDAASVWFSGQPVKKAGNRSDGYTTVPEYISKFRRNFVRT